MTEDIDQYDFHTLYVKTDTACKKQLEAAFDLMYEDFQKANPDYPIDTRYKINMPVNYKGEYYNFAFVFVADYRIYFMLLGKNPDGSPRLKDPSQPEVESNMLEPLISLCPYQLTPAVIAYKEDCLRKTLMLDNPDIDLTTPVEVETTGTFRVSPALAHPRGTHESKYMLRTALKVTTPVTDQEIKYELSMYSTSQKGPVDMCFKGRKITDYYPIVVRSEGIVYIMYDPDTKDASFSLHMNKILRIGDKTGPKGILLKRCEREKESILTPYIPQQIPDRRPKSGKGKEVTGTPRKNSPVTRKSKVTGNSRGNVYKAISATDDE